MPGALKAAADTVLRVGGYGGGSRVLACNSRVHLVNCVAGAATANVVDRSSVLSQALLLGKLLVKAEHGALLLAVDVACTAAAGGKKCVGWRGSELGARRWAGGGSTISHILGVDAGDVAGAASSSVDEVGGGNGWVRLSNAVGRHFEFGSCEDEVGC